MTPRSSAVVRLERALHLVPPRPRGLLARRGASGGDRNQSDDARRRTHPRRCGDNGRAQRPVCANRPLLRARAACGTVPRGGRPQAPRAMASPPCGRPLVGAPKPVLRCVDPDPSGRAARAGECTQLTGRPTAPRHPPATWRQALVRSSTSVDGVVDEPHVPGGWSDVISDAHRLWSMCAALLRAQVSDPVWHTAFEGVRAVDYDGAQPHARRRRARWPRSASRAATWASSATPWRRPAPPTSSSRCGSSLPSRPRCGRFRLPRLPRPDERPPAPANGGGPLDRPGVRPDGDAPAPVRTSS